MVTLVRGLGIGGWDSGYPHLIFTKTFQMFFIFYFFLGPWTMARLGVFFSCIDWPWYGAESLVAGGRLLGLASLYLLYKVVPIYTVTSILFISSF